MRSGTRFWLVLSGLCTGWLVGLTVTPIVHIVIASIVGSLAALTAAISGSGHLWKHSESSTHQVNPAPIALLLVGIVVGSALGISARVNSWLGPTAEKIIENWTSKTVGLDRHDVAQRLFDNSYPPAAMKDEQVAKVAPTANASTIPVLFTSSADECSEFQVKEGKDLRAALLSSVSNPRANAFARKVQDPVALRAAVEVFLCPAH